MNKIKVLTAFLPDFEGYLPQCKAVLTPEEQEKAEHYQLTRGLLRYLLAAETGQVASQLPLRQAEQGKPHLVGSEVQFNLSHSGDMAVFVISQRQPVGVDIERIKPMADGQAIADRFFSEDEAVWLSKQADPEQAFFKLWTCKEAYVKAIGKGLFHALHQFSVQFTDNSVQLINTEPHWRVQTFTPQENYCAAVVYHQDCQLQFAKIDASIFAT